MICNVISREKDLAHLVKVLFDKGSLKLSGQLQGPGANTFVVIVA